MELKIKAVNTTTSNWDAADLATEVKKGLVIEDDYNNQFVWIPVSNINEMVMCQSHKGRTTLDLETLQLFESFKKGEL